MLEFDPATHTYTYDGRVVPSVTQVIGEWIPVKHMGFDYLVNAFTGEMVAAEKFREAADFGTAVHKGAKLILTGEGLDWDALDPALEPPLRQLERWIGDFKVEPRHVEVPMYSKRYGVAGTPDIICFVLKNRLIVCDIKTGSLGAVGAQTAGYEILYREEYRRLSVKISRYALRLPKDGRPYDFIPMRNPEDKQFFLSRVFQYHYARKEFRS